MAGRANPDRDSDRDVDHELQVARYLAVAFIAQIPRDGLRSKRYAQMPVGSFWLDIARQVIAHMSLRWAQLSLPRSSGLARPQERGGR
jgi:hypothetical protein